MITLNPELKEIVAFLCGEAPLDGKWFEDGTKPKYWWRKSLRQAALVHAEKNFDYTIGPATAVNQLLSGHPSLRDLSKNDATIYAWFKQASLGRCTVEEALVGALVWVAQEKQKYFDEIVELNMKHGRTP